MNKFTVVKGDVLAADTGFIVHGCNDRGVMGSGVAAGVKVRYPKAFEIYRQAFEAHELTIGTCTFYQHTSDLWIVNAVTQTLGTANPLSYPAIRRCFDSTLNFIMALEMARDVPAGSIPILFPAIGAGRGGGDWNVISRIINDSLAISETVYRCKRSAMLFTIDVEPADCR